MKKISLVQPNFQQGPKELNAYYLPYSVGILWSYIQKFDHLRQSYELDHIVWRRDNVYETAKKIAQNDVVAFSTYVWCKNYNYALASEIKKLNPKCIIIFGGPELPITNKNIFKITPFIDIVVKSEGEIILKNLLEAFINQSPWEDIQGILINQSGTAIDTGDSSRISDLDDIPSPYLTGVFDKLIAETTDIEWNATLETNRGCPYQCTFCDWGSLTYNKVKKFGLERVLDELEWVGKHCGFVTITDANFGMFVERDNIIIDKLIEVQKKWGKLKSFSMTWAKNQKNEVVDIVKKLIKESPHVGQGLTVSVQSMDHDVLENIKRRNLDQHKIDEIFSLCDKNNIPVYTELILGLPGETKESWKEGIYKIIRAGNHTGMNLLQAQLLENAEMNTLQKKLYKITSVPVHDYMSGSYIDDLKETIEVVTGTASMHGQDMIDSLMFNWLIQTFHINGLTTFISRFLKKYQGLDYSVFYDKLEQRLLKDEWFKKERDETEHYYIKWMSDGAINHPKISKITVHGWNLVHRTTLNMHADKKYNHVFSVIEKFVLEELNLEKELASQLLQFQKNYVVCYDTIKEFPLTANFDYDFLGFLQEDKDLNSKGAYLFDFVEDKDISLSAFLENIYFGRKRNFGKSTVTYRHSP